MRWRNFTKRTICRVGLKWIWYRDESIFVMLCTFHFEHSFLLCINIHIFLPPSLPLFLSLSLPLFLSLSLSLCIFTYSKVWCDIYIRAVRTISLRMGVSETWLFSCWGCHLHPCECWMYWDKRFFGSNVEPKPHSVDNSTFFRPLVCCLIIVLQFLSEHSHGHDNRDDIGCLQTTKYNKQSIYIYCIFMNTYTYILYIQPLSQTCQTGTKKGQVSVGHLARFWAKPCC